MSDLVVSEMSDVELGIHEENTGCHMSLWRIHLCLKHFVNENHFTAVESDILLIFYIYVMNLVTQIEVQFLSFLE
jgi:hypothetical protein